MGAVIVTLSRKMALILCNENVSCEHKASESIMKVWYCFLVQYAYKHLLASKAA